MLPLKKRHLQLILHSQHSGQSGRKHSQSMLRCCMDPFKGPSWRKCSFLNSGAIEQLVLWCRLEQPQIIRKKSHNNQLFCMSFLSHSSADLQKYCWKKLICRDLHRYLICSMCKGDKDKDNSLEICLEVCWTSFGIDYK